MDKNIFWQSLETIKAKSKNNLDLYCDYLVAYLSDLSEDDIFKWHHIFDEYQKLSYKEKLWAAAYVINGGCSDDGFDYFRAWLTSQGKETFLNTLKNPDSLADYEEAKEDETSFEDIMSAPCSAYFKKKNIKDRDYGLYYSELDKHALTETEKNNIAAEICYDESIDCKWEEDNLETIVPMLCKRFDW